MKTIEVECYEVEAKFLVRKDRGSTKADIEKQIEVLIKEDNIDIEELEINVK